jgi:hypothetical protein
LAFKVLVDSGVGFLVGVLLNVIKDLKRVDHKKFLANKPDLPPHRDFNDKWDDDDDWPKKDQKKSSSFWEGGKSHKLNNIIVFRLTAAERFIKVVLRYGIAQMIERKLHAAIVNRVAQIVNDIQRHIATFANQRFLAATACELNHPVFTTVDQVDRGLRGCAVGSVAKRPLKAITRDARPGCALTLSSDMIDPCEKPISAVASPRRSAAASSGPFR